MQCYVDFICVDFETSRWYEPSWLSKKAWRCAVPKCGACFCKIIVLLTFSYVVELRVLREFRCQTGFFLCAGSPFATGGFGGLSPLKQSS